jgi:PEP-CTERM motif
MKMNLILLGLSAILSLSASTLHALPFADSVIRFQGGADFGVDDESDGTYSGVSGEGVFDPLAVTNLDGAVLALGGGGGTGTPGTLTMRFTGGHVIDGAGDDLRFYDTFSFPDGFSVDASADGSAFSHLFAFNGDLLKFSCSVSSPCITDVDLAGSGFAKVSYLRISTAGNSGQGFPAGYTLDAVEALHFQASPVPEPDTFALFSAGLGILTAVRRRKSYNKPR